MNARVGATDPRRGLTAASDLQLTENAVDVVLHRCVSDLQRARDLFVRQSLFQERDNLPLALGQNLIV